MTDMTRALDLWRDELTDWRFKPLPGNEWGGYLVSADGVEGDVLVKGRTLDEAIDLAKMHEVFNPDE